MFIIGRLSACKHKGLLAIFLAIFVGLHCFFFFWNTRLKRISQCLRMVRFVFWNNLCATQNRIRGFWWIVYAFCFFVYSKKKDFDLWNTRCKINFLSSLARFFNYFPFQDLEIASHGIISLLFSKIRNVDRTFLRSKLKIILKIKFLASKYENKAIFLILKFSWLSCCCKNIRKRVAGREKNLIELERNWVFDGLQNLLNTKGHVPVINQLIKKVKKWNFHVF